MSSNRFTMATLAGGVTMFIMGFLIYGVATMSFFEANQGSATGVMKPTLSATDYLHLGIGQLAFGALLAVVIGKWAGVTGAGKGLQVGAVLGLLTGFGTNFTMLGVTHVQNLTATLVDPFLVMIQLGIAGAVVGAVLGGGTK